MKKKKVIKKCPQFFRETLTSFKVYFWKIQPIQDTLFIHIHVTNQLSSKLFDFVFSQACLVL